MLLLGLLLLVAAGALTGGILVDNTRNSQAELFGFSLPHLTIGQLFLVGVGTGFLATLGLAMLLGGLRRGGRRRREQRAELKTKRRREDELKEENTRLARELEQQRVSPPASASTTGASTTGATTSDATTRPPVAPTVTRTPIEDPPATNPPPLRPPGN